MFQRRLSLRRQSIGMPKTVRPSQSAAGRADPQRLKIGYVSSDLRDHAVGFAGCHGAARP
jgi:predicted O-linked N-acetylglucosamine transferase (SPINDLY family)